MRNVAADRVIEIRVVAIAHSDAMPQLRLSSEKLLRLLLLLSHLIMDLQRLQPVHEHELVLACVFFLALIKLRSRALLPPVPFASHRIVGNHAFALQFNHNPVIYSQILMLFI